jgi:hypothetical protein
MAMELIRREIASGEDVAIKLFFEPALAPKQIAKLKDVLEDCPVSRSARESRSDIYQPRLELTKIEENRVIGLIARWFPEEWFEPLGRDIEARFPSLKQFEIGFDFETPSRDDSAFISVPRKIIELEDGSRTEVESFFIAKYPVSTAQFAQFVRERHYQTVAEQRNDEYCFRHVPGREIIPGGKEMALPVSYVSYLDATAYCEWAQVRLPNEIEWVAASVLDETIYDTRARAGERQAELRGSARALEEIGKEITATVVDRARVVIRCAPYLTQHRDEEWNRHNRMLVSLSYYQGLRFRVCKRDAR